MCWASCVVILLHTCIWYATVLYSAQFAGPSSQRASSLPTIYITATLRPPSPIACWSSHSTVSSPHDGPWSLVYHCRIQDTLQNDGAPQWLSQYMIHHQLQYLHMDQSRHQPVPCHHTLCVHVQEEETHKWVINTVRSARKHYHSDYRGVCCQNQPLPLPWGLLPEPSITTVTTMGSAART